MTGIEEAREALELVVKWEGREVAWDTPRARDLNTVAAALRGMIEAAERLSVPPTDDERDLARALFRTLYDAGVSFQSGDLIPRLTATVHAAGFRRQGPITDEVVVAAATALAGMPWENVSARARAYWIDEVRAALEAAERVRSAAPSTTEQESDR